MFNKKGQGSIEYLIILAAVIAVAAIVVVYIFYLQGGQENRIRVESQKTGCSSKGIDLPNYIDEFPVNATDAASWMIVKYAGEQMTCDAGPGPLDDLKSACKVGDDQVANGLIELQVNLTNCLFVNST